MIEAIVTVTKKGQATIPIRLRRKHKIGRKVLVVDTEAGVLLKPLPDPLAEKGALSGLFTGMNSGDLIDEARTVERARERATSRQ
jgi:bifunctional DNA-binding transcriptional regulator/antitoxin component of YhaV-PrlF toxin-antitoxin module